MLLSPDIRPDFPANSSCARTGGSFATGAGTLQPYARLNVYRSAKGNDVARFVNPAAITPVGAPVGGSSSTELAAGFTLAVSQRTSLYGELGKLRATGGARGQRHQRGGRGSGQVVRPRAGA
jgi:hypothetical protein